MAIASMRLRLYVTGYANGGVTLQLEWTQGSNNWGTSVTATQADFESTGEFVEGTQPGTATGYIYFDLTPADFNFSLPLYVRIVDTTYNNPDTKNTSIATQNHGTAAWRPVLIITEETGHTIDVPVATLTLTANAPGVSVTENHYVSVASKALALTGHAPSVSTTNSHNISVGVSSLLLTANAPGVSVTDLQSTSVPLATLAITPHAPSISVTDNHYIIVGAKALAVQVHAPIISTTENHVCYVPTKALRLRPYAPIFVYSETIAHKMQIIRSAEQIGTIQADTIDTIRSVGRSSTLNAKARKTIRAKRRNFTINSGSL